MHLALKSDQMRRVRTRGTNIERILRKALSTRKIRYRLNVTALPGTPDILIPRLKIALFANGCFWHGHDCRKGQSLPKTNRAFWNDKISATVARDVRDTAALMDVGFKVVVVWECEIRNVASIAETIAEQYRAGANR